MLKISSVKMGPIAELNNACLNRTGAHGPLSSRPFLGLYNLTY